MHSAHPLELPEVISHVARFIPRRQLPACARVSRAWYQALVPLLWELVRVNFRRRRLPDALEKHKHLVKTIKAYQMLVGNARVVCPNLKSLEVGDQLQVEHLTTLILDHPSIMRLELFVFKPVSDIGLWDKLLGYQHLKELSLTSIWVAAMNVDVFWQLCARLQRVDFSNLMLESRGSLASMEFPLIKEVHLRRGNELVSFDFILRCPELVSCHWIAASKTISQLRPGFVEQYAMMKWPNLHTLDLHFDEGFTEDDLIKIFGGQQRINSLSVHCTPSSITPTSMASLRQRFGYLTTLAVTWPIDCNETSPMAQEILSSCPLLEELTAPRIDAAVIAQGQPWVCLWLKTLTLSIKFDPLTNHSIQPLVFNQLSRLERLRNVYLCTELRGDDHGLTRFQEAVDMRLDNGLGKLSTLRTLQSLDWGIASQRMGEQEIEWMLQHWRCLERVRGKAFNAQDHGLDKLLERRLQDDGVEVFRIG